jgi:3-oxoacyl-[acyl-carrier protein] reductase
VLKIAEEKKMTISTELKKTVLVTGGSKGIGAAIAKKLAKDGFQVALVYNKSKESADQLVKDIQSLDGRAQAFKANVNSSEEVSQLVKKVRQELGPVTNLVHCASPTPIPQETMQVPWETFEDHINTQIKGAFLLTKELNEDMVAANQGSIIFISSIFAEGTPPVQQAAYVTAKAGLSALSRALAVELGPKNIRINTVSPGMTETDMIATLPEKTKMLTKMQTPLRRLAKADDIADTVSFLMSSSAKHITGENIKVCGGITMG